MSSLPVATRHPVEHLEGWKRFTTKRYGHQWVFYVPAVHGSVSMALVEWSFWNGREGWMWRTDKQSGPADSEEEAKRLAEAAIIEETLGG